MSGDHCLVKLLQDFHSGARQTHVASRRGLISKSDNNYQEEFTQDDFFCDFYASPTQGRGDNSIRRKGSVSKDSPWSWFLD